MEQGSNGSAKAAGLNLVFPGLGYIALGRRKVLGALVASASVVWGVLGLLHIVTLDAHWGHLGPSAFPGIGAQVMLYGVHHALIGAATAWDVYRPSRTRNAQGASTA